METPVKLSRMDELDGLRGFLAAWVALAHLLCWTGFATLSLRGSLELWWEQAVFAQPAVEVFMILSGFAISFLLNAKPLSYRAFMAGRFYRIYPTYLCCLALGAGAMYLTPFVLRTASWHETIYFQWSESVSQNERRFTAAHVMAHLSLLNGLIPRRILAESTAAILTPAWSISLEWQYYLAAPWIASLVRSRMGILVLVLAGLAGMHVGVHWMNPHLAFLPARLPLFLVGIGSFHLYRWAKSCQSWPAIARTHFVPIAALVAGVVLLSSNVLSLALWCLTFGCVLAGAEKETAGGLPWVRRVLLHRGLQFLGRISYPLYLVHWPVIIACLAGLLRWNASLRPSQAAVLMLFIAVPFMGLAAWLLHRFVEVPMMARGKQKQGG